MHELRVGAEWNRYTINCMWQRDWVKDTAMVVWARSGAGERDLGREFLGRGEVGKRGKQRIQWRRQLACSDIAVPGNCIMFEGTD